MHIDYKVKRQNLAKDVGFHEFDESDVRKLLRITHANTLINKALALVTLIDSREKRTGRQSSSTLQNKIFRYEYV